jgi:transcription elongation factor Elf1
MGKPSDKLNNVKAIRELLSEEHKSQKRRKIRLSREENDDSGKEERRNRLKKLRQQYNVAYKCPRCGKILNTNQDIKFYKLTGMCFDCKIEEDTKMIIDGTFKEYEFQFMYNNLIAFLNNTEKNIVNLQDLVSDAQYVNQDGSVEKWNVPYTEEEFKNKIKTNFESLKSDLLKRYKEYLNDIKNKSNNNGMGNKTK